MYYKYEFNFRHLPGWHSSPTLQGNDQRGRGRKPLDNSNLILAGSTVSRPRHRKPSMSMFQKFLVDLFISIVDPASRKKIDIE